MPVCNRNARHLAHPPGDKVHTASRQGRVIRTGCRSQSIPVEPIPGSRTPNIHMHNAVHSKAGALGFDTSHAIKRLQSQEATASINIGRCKMVLAAATPRHCLPSDARLNVQHTHRLFGSRYNHARSTRPEKQTSHSLRWFPKPPLQRRSILLPFICTSRAVLVRFLILAGLMIGPQSHLPLDGLRRPGYVDNAKAAFADSLQQFFSGQRSSPRLQWSAIASH